ncbi:MAG: hypothetical protein JWN70_6347 [Planctomycetaceae bacterium]|nr:hypothetical protein [Planctomycetaceae bacterium]
MYHEYSALFATVLLVLCSTLLGCGNATTDTSVRGVHVPQTERLEHHQAPHHPRSYAAAVSQIELRHARIQAELGRITLDALKRELREMLDILEWLPTIAADSDLKKPEWDQVKQCATQLTEFYDSYASAANSGHRPPGTPRNECRRAIESLRTLMPAADRRP